MRGVFSITAAEARARRGSRGATKSRAGRGTGRHPRAGGGEPAPEARVGELARDLGVSLKLDAPLAPLTWLGIGGSTPFLLRPKGAEVVPALLAGLHSLGLSPRWLGAGSNVLIDDRGILEPVLCTEGIHGGPRPLGGGLVRVLAGSPLPGFTRWLVGHGLAGLEFAEGIPGSVGGAVAMNAGAFDQAVGERAERIVLVHADGRSEERTVAPGDFSYRSSSFRAQGALILETVFRLSEGDPVDLERTLERYRQHRRQTQPLSEESAGCIFKNPEDGPSAGALIERCGLKGRTRGEAQVSCLHANFIINRGSARFTDVRVLVEEVKDQVCRQTGILLEEEVQIWARP
ncbi:MAG: UDP-N-acetylmuramate dehydrogenase [Acidobacteriota bacterium]